jgi:hypothetical protein
VRAIAIVRDPLEEELLFAEALNLGGKVIVSTWDNFSEIERFADVHLNHSRGVAWRVDVKDAAGTIILKFMPGPRPKKGKVRNTDWHHRRV